MYRNYMKEFLLISGVDSSYKALMEQTTLCWPKTTGALNFLDNLIQNRAIICKMLWNLHYKKDKIWIQLAHIYYGDQASSQGVLYTKAFWVVTKVLKAYKQFELAGWELRDVLLPPENSPPNSCM